MGVGEDEAVKRLYPDEVKYNDDSAYSNNNNTQLFTIGDWVRYINSVSDANPNELKRNHLGRVTNINKQEYSNDSTYEYQIDWILTELDPKDWFFVAVELESAIPTEEEIELWAIKVMKR